MAERKPPEYYNTQKLWYPEGKEPSPEERFYSDPNVERGIVPALKSIANAPREWEEMKMQQAQPDGFGHDILQVDEATRRNKRIATDHLFVWNRLIENASPNKTKMDELNPNRALQTLMTDEAFKNFLSKKTLQEKMTVLRDVGMHRSADMSDEALAKYLMTHVPDALTEDPAVGKEAKQMENNQNDGYGNIPYISNALKRRDEAMNPEGY